ncbi:hypothetical protein AQJ30_15700 [Streptomyces longwoodensis]|uniref:Uncharacterized protein n=1 Tax=Streptomyces longwoodensis TaxID=68231 RepID=A0A101QXG2_9ACTN|nr:hypothetical protein [Streptomyces longwoodensis]KUN37727.1 hypothetical protein AQJ30_15700 [Streptomyces longwoodensis]
MTTDVPERNAPVAAGEQPEPGERPVKQRALALPDLRPYADPKAVAGLARQGIAASRQPAASVARRTLRGIARVARRTPRGIARVARAFGTGNRTLARLLWGWLDGSHGEKLSLPARLGGVVLVVAGAVHTIADYGAAAWIPLAWGWFQGSVMTGAGMFDRLLGKAEPQGTGQASQKGPEAAPAGRRKGLARLLRQAPATAPQEADGQDLAEPPLTALIRELIGDDNGVHLQVLRPAMRERLPGLADAGDKQLREVLVEAGFDPSRTFRAGGVAGRSGVHRDELPPLPSPGSGQEDSPPPESGSDVRKSPGGERAESRLERGWRRRRKLPAGWTEADVARGHRTVADPERGPSAWKVERLDDVQ